MKIAVVHGGFSEEANYSTENAICVNEALKRLNYDSYLLEYDLNIVENLKEQKPDMVFLCVQGKYHGDGTFQGILQLLGIPFTGSKMERAAIINDKVICQTIFADNKLPVSKHFNLRKEEYEADNGLAMFKQKMAENNIDFPVVSKNPSQGACIGIHYIANEDRYEAVGRSFINDEEILIEEFAKGFSVTVALLEKEGIWMAFPPIAADYILPSDDKTEYMITNDYHRAPMSEAAEKKIKETAIEAAKVIGAKDYCRVDFQYNPEDESFVLFEVNAVPGLRTISYYPAAVKEGGMSYDELIKTIVDNCLKEGKYV